MQMFHAVEKLEEARAVDGVAGLVANAVRSVLPAEVRDALHGVWLGHPLHPTAVQAPVGCFLAAGVLDALPGGGPGATSLVAAGLISAPAAVASGLTDFSELHPRQQRVGLVHALANATATLLYGGSLAARLTGRRGLGRLLGYAGLGAVSLGGFLGGHLSFRQASGANHAEEYPYVLGADWHEVCPLDELPEGTPERRLVADEPLLLVRQGEVVHALAGRCSHLGGPLWEGQLQGDDDAACIVCPWHGSTFRLRDGAVVRGPATSPQLRLTTRVVDGVVQVRADQG